MFSVKSMTLRNTILTHRCLIELVFSFTIWCARYVPCLVDFSILNFSAYIFIHQIGIESRSKKLKHICKNDSFGCFGIEIHTSETGRWPKHQNQEKLRKEMAKAKTDFQIPPFLQRQYHLCHLSSVTSTNSLPLLPALSPQLCHLHQLFSIPTTSFNLSSVTSPNSLPFPPAPFANSHSVISTTSAI